MNFLEKYVPNTVEERLPGTYSISDFREIQYKLIPEFINICMNYLRKISNDYFIFKDIQETNIYKYLDIYGYMIKKITIDIENPEDRKETQHFMTFNLPKLIRKSFFYLNGSYYSPCLYITDKPIIYKKNSIKLYGLINSITIFFKNGNMRVIFGGRNIPLEYFLQWFLDEDDPSFLSDVKNTFKIGDTKYSEEQLLDYFSGFFNCSKEKDEINKYFNDLFFDDYTKKLYGQSYGREFTFKELVYFALLNYIENKTINFVDLKEKRLVFVEILMTPFFQRIGDMAFNFIYGQRFSAINFNENEILKYLNSSKIMELVEYISTSS